MGMKLSNFATVSMSHCGVFFFPTQVRIAETLFGRCMSEMDLIACANLGLCLHKCDTDEIFYIKKGGCDVHG